MNFSITTTIIAEQILCKKSSFHELFKSVAFVENESIDQEICILEVPSLGPRSSIKLIAGLKLAIARINPVHIEGGKAAIKKIEI